MKIILLGPPAAGKGTQSAYLSKYYDIPAISTGSIIRNNISEGTELGTKAKVYIDEGKLVPDELVMDLVAKRIAQPDCKNGYILDGFPRTVAQAEAMEKLGINVDKIVELVLPDEEIVDRISGRRNCSECGAIYHTKDHPSKAGDRCDKCGGKLVQRADDTEETIKKRLEVYHEKTQPLGNYYAAKGNLVQIDSSGLLEDTSAAVRKAFGVE
ncbi:MAG: adenylate kinase [Bacillota bacterium]|nr:adenylate kinase [Bacillota bacterium]